MSDISKEYIDEKFSGVDKRMDDFSSTLRDHLKNVRADKKDIYEKVNKNTTDISTIEATRPTLAKMIAASGIVAGILIAVAQFVASLLN